MIYFIEAEGLNLIKIGFTDRRMGSRLAALRSSSAVALTLLGVIEGTVKDEKRTHVRFIELWHHGEWFRAEPGLRRYIADHACPWAPVPLEKEKLTKREKNWGKTLLEAHGITKTADEWSRFTGVSVSYIKFRCQAGWTLESVFQE